MYNATAADLEIGDRVTHNYVPTDEIRRGGVENCKKAAINEVLSTHGNADLLVEPEYVLSFDHGRVVNVTVTGRPAKYVNFRSLGDDVWTNPTFRAAEKPKAEEGKGLKLFK